MRRPFSFSSGAGPGAGRRAAPALVFAAGCIMGLASLPTQAQEAAPVAPSEAVRPGDSPGARETGLAAREAAAAREARREEAAREEAALDEAGAEAAGELTPDTIDALVRAHAIYVESGDAQRALDAALLLREYHEERYGADSFEALPWVKLVAYSYARLGQYRDAARAFERAVLLTERYEGMFSYSLIDLLGSQSRTLVELGEPETAESALLRAKFITHRRLGINNLEQVPIVRQLSDFYLRSLAGEKAEREQLFLLRLWERNFGETPELVPGLLEHANYYLDIGDFQSALPVYRRAVDILEEAYGEDDLRLVEPLQGIALVYTKRDQYRGEGERALERCVELYDASGSADVLDHAASLVRLGDWHMRSNNSDQAIAAYRRAWELLVEADGGDARARALLGEPYRLEYIAPVNVYSGWEGRSYLSQDRFIEVAFEVTDDGRVEDVTIVGGDATRRTEFDTLRAMRAARYRPAFADGEPVTVRVTMRQYYRN